MRLVLHAFHFTLGNRNHLLGFLEPSIISFQGSIVEDRSQNLVDHMVVVLKGVLLLSPYNRYSLV